MEPTSVCLEGDLRRIPTRSLDVTSFDQEFQTISHLGNGIIEIEKHVLKDEVSVYPQITKDVMDMKNILYNRIKEIRSHGLAYVTDNLFVSANIPNPKPGTRQQDIILDVLLLFDGMAPTVFTLLPDEAVSEDIEAYNYDLAVGITMAIRTYTTEQFSVVYGIVHESSLQNKEDFNKCLSTIRDKTSRWCIPNSLKMPSKKCRNIIRAFLSSVAVTASVYTDDNSDTLWLLTREQFCILSENIDRREVVVRSSSSSGGKVLMREVARRLERSGPTALVVQTMEQCQIAKQQETCSFIMTLAEWKDVTGRDGDGCLDNVNFVTNCPDCPSYASANGKKWTFIQETMGTGDVATGEIRDIYTPESDIDEDYSGAERLTIQGLRRQLESEREENKWLRGERSNLLQTIEDLESAMDEVSIGGHSLDSGFDSDNASIYQNRRTVSVSEYSIHTRGSTGPGQAKKLLGRIKKTLLLRGSRIKAEKEVYVYLLKITNKEQTTSLYVQSRTQEMDVHRVNVNKCRVDESGWLTNSPHPGPVHSRNSFKKYGGTCSTSVIVPSHPSSKHPYYWETVSDVHVKGEGGWLQWPPILEIGLVEEKHLDKDVWAHGRTGSWCIRVGECETHRPGFCIQVWNEKALVKCFPAVLFSAIGSRKTLRFGVVLDIVGGRLGFIDNDGGKVLHVIHKRFRQTLCPVFGAFRDASCNVKIRLYSGNEIVMTREKEMAVMSCLS